MLMNVEIPKVLRRALEITLQNYALAAVLTLAVFVLVPCWVLWYFSYFVGFVFVCDTLAVLVDEWRPRHIERWKDKAVFITGCDSGFGHILATRLAGIGVHVFAGCLFPDEEGPRTLRESYPENLHVVPLDVTSSESVQHAVEYVKKHIGENKFWALVNNAGINDGGELAYTKLETIKKIFDVNLFGAIGTTQAFMPLILAEKARIVTVASLAGFCDGLRLELYKLGIKVIAITPATYATAITNKQRIMGYVSKTWDHCPDDIKQFYPKDHLGFFETAFDSFYRDTLGKDPQDVVDCLEEAIFAIDPKEVYFPGPAYIKFMYWSSKWVPRSVNDAFMLARMMLK